MTGMVEKIIFNVSKPLFASNKAVTNLIQKRIYWIEQFNISFSHYSDIIMSAMASQITGFSMVCSNVCSGADQRKRQSSASLAFVRGIHRRPVNFPHKEPVTRKMFPFDTSPCRRNYCVFILRNVTATFMELVGWKTFPNHLIFLHVRYHRWNRNFVSMTKFLSLAALNVVKMTSSAANN